VIVVLAASALKRQHIASVCFQLRDCVGPNINLYQAADQVGTNHMKTIEIDGKNLKRDSCIWNQQLSIDFQCLQVTHPTPKPSRPFAGHQASQGTNAPHSQHLLPAHQQS
jgi:hypothetical protein